MAKRKTGLKRGLDALLATKKPKVNTTEEIIANDNNTNDIVSDGDLKNIPNGDG